MATDVDLAALRTPPPDFRRLTLRSVTALTPRMTRMVIGGDELAGFDVPDPAASVRLLVPEPGADALVVPTWRGNEFLHDDGSRPIIRTFTPRHVDPDAQEMTIDVVLHDGGAVTGWLEGASIGDEVAISGPGRGFDVPTDGTLVLAGDETAIPAIAQIVEQAPPGPALRAIVEMRTDDARLDLTGDDRVRSEWLVTSGERGSVLVDALRSIDLDGDVHVWAAGEAQVMQAIRTLLRDRGLDRSRMTVRGYWKDRG